LQYDARYTQHQITSHAILLTRSLRIT
jgi:hypothetical protein